MGVGLFFKCIFIFLQKGQHSKGYNAVRDVVCSQNIQRFSDTPNNKKKIDVSSAKTTGNHFLMLQIFLVVFEIGTGEEISQFRVFWQLIPGRQGNLSCPFQSGRPSQS